MDFIRDLKAVDEDVNSVIDEGLLEKTISIFKNGYEDQNAPIRYLGEFLERYHQYSGDGIVQLRGVAFGLASIIKDVKIDDDSFEHTQLDEFTEKLNDANDIYLKCALSMINKSEREKIYEELLSKKYENTEEILFLSIFFAEYTDVTDLFERLKDELIRLLEENRNLLITKKPFLFARFISDFHEKAKNCRTHNSEVLRLLLKIFTHYLKPGSVEFNKLCDHGYSVKEILTANLHSNQNSRYHKRTKTSIMIALDYCVDSINGEAMTPYVSKKVSFLFEYHQELHPKVNGIAYFYDLICREINPQNIINLRWIFDNLLDNCQYNFEYTLEMYSSIILTKINIYGNEWSSLYKQITPFQLVTIYAENMLNKSSDKNAINALMQHYNQLGFELDFITSICTFSILKLAPVLKLFIQEGIYTPIFVLNTLKKYFTKNDYYQRRIIALESSIIEDLILIKTRPVFEFWQEMYKQMNEPDNPFYVVPFYTGWSEVQQRQYYHSNNYNCTYVLKEIDRPFLDENEIKEVVNWICLSAYQNMNALKFQSFVSSLLLSNQIIDLYGKESLSLILEEIKLTNQLKAVYWTKEMLQNEAMEKKEQEEQEKQRRKNEKEKEHKTNIDSLDDFISILKYYRKQYTQRDIDFCLEIIQKKLNATSIPVINEENATAVLHLCEHLYSHDLFTLEDVAETANKLIVRPEEGEN